MYLTQSIYHDWLKRRRSPSNCPHLSYWTTPTHSPLFKSAMMVHNRLKSPHSNSPNNAMTIIHFPLHHGEGMESKRCGGIHPHSSKCDCANVSPKRRRASKMASCNGSRNSNKPKLRRRKRATTTPTATRGVYSRRFFLMCSCLYLLSATGGTVPSNGGDDQKQGGGTTRFLRRGAAAAAAATVVAAEDTFSDLNDDEEENSSQKPLHSITNAGCDGGGCLHIRCAGA
mmetsp:Transcript_9619/g.20810  ORF Transcript_9619/g.20810 Transcript_9619/m.20810 type:complete len:228 (-) Transcript_9619:444-1127(-)